MNCKEISRYLDERGFTRVSGQESAQIEAHVSDCGTCAEQWRASQALSAFRSAIPPAPASLSERARQLDEACESAESRRRLRRPLIIGSLFLVGAASAMLGTLQWPGERPEFVE